MRSSWKCINWATNDALHWHAIENVPTLWSLTNTLLDIMDISARQSRLMFVNWGMFYAQLVHKKWKTIPKICQEWCTIKASNLSVPSLSITAPLRTVLITISEKKKHTHISHSNLYLKSVRFFNTWDGVSQNPALDHFILISVALVSCPSLKKERKLFWCGILQTDTDTPTFEIPMCARRICFVTLDPLYINKALSFTTN